MDHKELRVFQLARHLARDLRRAVADWDSFDQWSTGIQLVRAANSVGANIAEARGRWHRADQQRLLYIARGSLYETEHWIEVAQEGGLLPTDASAPIADIARTLNGLIRSRQGS